MRRMFRNPAKVALLLLALVPLMGAKCARSVHDNIVGGSLDYVNSTTEMILTNLLPFGKLFAPPADGG